MSESRWYKGNLHCHTTGSDGDASPEQVVEWFRDHGYHWLVLSDHNRLTILPEDVDTPQSGKALMITGEELTVQLEDQEVAVHVSCVGISRALEPINAAEILPTIQANVAAVLGAEGIAMLSPPYYRPGFDTRTLIEIEGAKLMDIFNAHPTNVEGDPRTFSFEEIWDTILSSGKTIFGTATDDSHHYLEFGPHKANPGRAWVVTRAAELSAEAIIESLAKGDFYSSTGVSLRDVQEPKEALSLEIDQTGDQSYVTSFIGRGGVVLAEEAGLEASYRIRGDEGYVRARVTSSDGARAWTQPVVAG